MTDSPSRTARIARYASVPRRAAVPTTDRTPANRSAPHLERNPPVTFRYVAVGRNSLSLPLLSGGTSGCSRNVNKWPRTLPYRFRSRLPCWLVGASELEQAKRRVIAVF